MTIRIDKSSVVDGMHRNSALLALKSENGVPIAYNDDDAQRMEPLWMASLDELLELLAPFARMSKTHLPALWNPAMCMWRSSRQRS